jgi:hypothetical protein
VSLSALYKCIHLSLQMENDLDLTGVKFLSSGLQVYVQVADGSPDLQNSWSVDYVTRSFRLLAVRIIIGNRTCNW